MWAIIIINGFILGFILLLPLFEKLWMTFNRGVVQIAPPDDEETEIHNILREKDEEVPYPELMEKLYLSPKFVRTLSVQSGIPCPYNIFIFFVTASSLIGGGTLAFLWRNDYLAMFSWHASLLCTIVSAFLCIYIPHIFLYINAKKRIQTVDKNIGSFIDLMIICLDAGLTLSQALVFVAEECKNTSPLLAHELERTNLDCTLLLSTNQAFSNLLERVPSKKIKQFVSVVQQHHNEGAVIHDSLYQMSISVYRDSMTVITERAQKMPGLLSAMSVIFTVPMIFIVSFGPYIVDLMALFGHD